MCKKCYNTVTVRIAVKKKQRCAKCGEENRIMEGCERDAAKCYHCKEEHVAGNFKCAEYKYQAEIKAVQSKKKKFPEIKL